MTAQEALDYFIRRKAQLGISDKIQQAETLAISALEKQIPKKPTAHKVEVSKIKVGNGFGKGTTVYRCPCCNELISRICDCCYKCGQAIDWSDFKRCLSIT